MGAVSSSRSALLKGDPGPGLAFIEQLPEVDREAALMGLCSGLPMQRANELAGWHKRAWRR
jgi:hypothetical protein